MWCAGFDHKTTEKDIHGKTCELQIKSGITVKHQCWFRSFDKYTMVIYDGNFREHSNW